MEMSDERCHNDRHSWTPDIRGLHVDVATTYGRNTTQLELRITEGISLKVARYVFRIMCRKPLILIMHKETNLEVMAIYMRDSLVEWCYLQQ